MRWIIAIAAALLTLATLAICAGVGIGAEVIATALGLDMRWSVAIGHAASGLTGAILSLAVIFAGPNGTLVALDDQTAA